MASKTEIANLAISHLGTGKDIANLDTENSQEANACRRFYETALREVLRDFAWPFATKFAELALVESDPTTEWSYSYRYPSEAVNIRRIFSNLRHDTRQSRIEFKIGHDDSGLLIYCDEPTPCAEYTEYVTNVEIYPRDFQMMLALLLAAYIAPRVTGGDPYQMGERALKFYNLKLDIAKNNSKNEEQALEEPKSEYERERM